MMEIHSGDLTRPCPRNIQLRMEGKFNPEMQTAMYRGSFASYLMEHLHRGGEWDEAAVCAAGILAIGQIGDDIKKEQRELSETVENNRGKIHEEVLWCVQEYARRLGPMFAKCKFIGCETPCRVTIEAYAPPHDTPLRRVDLIHGRFPHPIEFASHTDLLFRAPKMVLREFFPHLGTSDHAMNGNGTRLCLWDFKFTEKSPTWDYLMRQPQLLLYVVCCNDGAFLLDDFWVEFNEWPAIAWCHLPYLKPFKRKTVCEDDEGMQTEYVKGDVRPLKNVVRWCNYRFDRIDEIRQELCQRPLMYEQGLFPMIPDPIGCHLCESRAWCPRFDLAQLQGDNP